MSIIGHVNLEVKRWGGKGEIRNKVREAGGTVPALTTKSLFAIWWTKRRLFLQFDYKQLTSGTRTNDPRLYPLPFFSPEPPALRRSASLRRWLLSPPKPGSHSLVAAILLVVLGRRRKAGKR